MARTDPRWVAGARGPEWPRGATHSAVHNEGRQRSPVLAWRVGDLCGCWGKNKNIHWAVLELGPGPGAALFSVLVLTRCVVARRPHPAPRTELAARSRSSLALVACLNLLKTREAAPGCGEGASAGLADAHMHIDIGVFQFELAPFFNCRSQIADIWRGRGGGDRPTAPRHACMWPKRGWERTSALGAG